MLWGGNVDGVEHVEDDDDDDGASLAAAAQQQQQQAPTMSALTATGMQSTVGMKHTYHLLTAHTRAVSGSRQRHSQWSLLAEVSGGTTTTADAAGDGAHTVRKLPSKNGMSTRPLPLPSGCCSPIIRSQLCCCMHPLPRRGRLSFWDSAKRMLFLAVLLLLLLLLLPSSLPSLLLVVVASTTSGGFVFLKLLARENGGGGGTTTTTGGGIRRSTRVPRGVSGSVSCDMTRSPIRHDDVVARRPFPRSRHDGSRTPSLARADIAFRQAARTLALPLVIDAVEEDEADALRTRNINARRDIIDLAGTCATAAE